MKFFHLADLHIGKLLHEVNLLKDQRYILWQILGLADEYRPDGVILSGDIYDKAVPSAEAVSLFDEFLTELAEREIQVFLISGNHDSAERLQFAAGILRHQNVYVKGVFDGNLEKIALRDETAGAVNLYLLPFIKPFDVRGFYPEETIDSYDHAVRTVVEHAEIAPGETNILVAHQFVTGAVSSESESVMVGGLDNIGSDAFAPFDYVALGHLHRPQRVARETVRYAGTPLAYSFDPKEGEKSVTLIEIMRPKEITLSYLPLKPLHPMREVRGLMEEVMAMEPTEDYVKVVLTDEEIILNTAAKLHTIFPNLLTVEFDYQRRMAVEGIENAQQMIEKTPEELFADFYLEQSGKELSGEDRELIRKLAEEMAGER